MDVLHLASLYERRPGGDRARTRTPRDLENMPLSALAFAQPFEAPREESYHNRYNRTTGMGLTALQTHGRGLGAASVGEYRGATTALRFGDPQAEFAALRGGCGVYDLGFRAKISLTGGDRVRWLNGMVTNNIRDLGVGQGVYAFLLNPQGHILGDFYGYNRGKSITVDTDLGQVEKILATFDHYIIMDDVEVTNLSGQVTALGIAGPKSGAVLAAAGFTIPEMRAWQTQSVMWQGTECTLVRGEDAEHASYEIWVPPASARQLWDALLAAGANPVGSEAVEMQRIVSGIPRYGVDIRERDLPQETEQARALNFNKGCYVGQEIVERIRSRGAVHRKFTGFVADGAGQIAPGIKIIAGEKEVGEITSAASLHLNGGEKTVALGYIRREVGLPGREVMIGSAKATVVQLPVTDSMLLQQKNSIESPSLEHHPV
jgi:folate-binding protein YgfZ